MLAHGGTTIVKIFLHISREEQGQRLTERLERPDKRWKTDRSDFTERTALGRLPRRVHRGDRTHLHRHRLLVRGAGEPQVVPELGGEPDPRRDAQGDGPPLSGASPARRPRRHGATAITPEVRTAPEAQRATTTTTKTA